MLQHLFIIRSLHTQLSRRTRPQLTPHQVITLKSQSELMFNNSIVSIDSIVDFFCIRYYVEPSYTTKSYVPAYYNTEAPKWVNSISMNCSQYQLIFFFLLQVLRWAELLPTDRGPCRLLFVHDHGSTKLLRRPDFLLDGCPFLFLLPRNVHNCRSDLLFGRGTKVRFIFYSIYPY